MLHTQLAGAHYYLSVCHQHLTLEAVKSKLVDDGNWKDDVTEAGHATHPTSRNKFRGGANPTEQVRLFHKDECPA